MKKTYIENFILLTFITIGVIILVLNIIYLTLKLLSYNFVY